MSLSIKDEVLLLFETLVDVISGQPVQPFPGANIAGKVNPIAMAYLE